MKPHISVDGIYEEVEILHWGIEYEQIQDPYSNKMNIVQYTIVFIKRQDGLVDSISPYGLKYLKTQE